MSTTPPLDLDEMRQMARAPRHYSNYTLAAALHTALDRMEAAEAVLVTAQDREQEAHTMLRYTVNALAFIQDEANAKYAPSVAMLAAELRQKIMDAMSPPQETPDEADQPSRP